AEMDARIFVVVRPQNGHISASSNTALAAAKGDYVALLDHDDAFSDQALYRVVEALQRNPSAALLYSDEDKITEFGTRYGPHFKAELSMELFYAMNCISHLGVYRREVLSAIGGFRLGLEGSQDYDLALRTIEHSGCGAVVHLPFILYHWRTLPTSTSSDGATKPYAFLAAKRALEEHFARRKLRRDIMMMADGFYKWQSKEDYSNIAVDVFVYGAGDLSSVNARTEEIARATLHPAATWHVIALRSDRRDEMLPALLEQARTRLATSSGRVVVWVDARLTPNGPTWLGDLVMHVHAGLSMGY
ncbi:MAG: glycosyltransferase, partial [Cytophagaceae bacterium]